jgi:class 3 adenylate cyclase
LVQSVVGWAFDRFAEEVERYERMLETFMDDALLAVFGVPRGVQSSSCSTLVRRHRAGERLEAEGREDSNGTGVPRLGMDEWLGGVERSEWSKAPASFDSQLLPRRDAVRRRLPHSTRAQRTLSQ